MQSSDENQCSECGANGPEVRCATVVVQQWDGEFVLDFVDLTPMPRVVARLVMLADVCTQFVESLRTAMTEYRQRHGGSEVGSSENGCCERSEGGAVRLLATLRELNHESVGLAPLYREMTVPEHLLGGIYTNHARIRFTQEVFSLEFLASFLPRAVVACRLSVLAQHLPAMLASLESESRRYRHGEANPSTGWEEEGSDFNEPLAESEGSQESTIPSIPEVRWPVERDCVWELQVRQFVRQVARRLADNQCRLGQPLGRTCRMARLSGGRFVYGYFQLGEDGLLVAYRTTDFDLADVYEGESLTPPFLTQGLDECPAEWLTSLIVGNLLEFPAEALSAELTEALADRLLTSDR